MTATDTTQLTLNEKMRKVVDEERELRAVLPITDGRAILVTEVPDYVKQMSIEFAERVQAFVALAKEIGFDAGEIEDRFAFHLSLYADSRVQDARRDEKLFWLLSNGERANYVRMTEEHVQRVRAMGVEVES
jgi:hypothetical protein